MYLRIPDRAGPFGPSEQENDTFLFWGRQHRLSGLLPQHLTYTDHSTRLTMPPVPQSLRSSVRCTRRGPHVVPLTFSRSASHGAPHYNEPTGFLFGEKVRPKFLSHPRKHNCRLICAGSFFKIPFSPQLRAKNVGEKNGS